MSRRELFLWLAAILLANQLLSPVPGTTGLSSPFDGSAGETFVHALLSKSVFYYLGWYVAFSLLLASESTRSVARSDVVAACGLALANFMPGGLGWNWLATTAAGVLIHARSQHDVNLKAAAAVLLALAFNGFWGPKLFNALAYYILHIDAALVGLTLVLTQPGMGWDGTIVGRADGHSLIIFGPCSSFHNISLGLLCWVSITKLVRPTWVRSDFSVALIVCAAVILLNAARLYLMALSADHYAYWHQGPGEQIVAWAMTVLVLVISLWGALRPRVWA